MPISSVQYRDVQNLVKYATATGVNHSQTIGEAAKEGVTYAAVSGGMWVLQNSKNLKGAWEAVKASDVAAKQIMQEATAGGKTIKNIWNGASKIVESRAATEAAATGAQATKGFWSKFLTKGGGGVAMAAFDMVTGTIFDVIPAFKLGKEQGFKQLGKTTAKAAATGVGWWAGSALGAKAGAAIGTAVCPGLGTIIGGVVGFIGGCLGSWLCNKAVDKVLGPSEVEKAQQEAAQQATDQVAQTGEGADEVASAAYQRLIQSYIDNKGKLSEEDLKAKESLENLYDTKIDLEKEAREYQKAQAQQTEQAQTTQQTQVQADTQAQVSTPATTTTQSQGAEASEETEEEKKKKEAEKKAKQQPLSQVFGSITAQASMPTPQISYFSETTGVPYYNIPIQSPQIGGFSMSM